MLNELAKKITKINKANGWDGPTTVDWAKEHVIPCYLALVHSEVSEAYEGIYKDDLFNFKEELADIVIRVLHVSDKLDINMDSEIVKVQNWVYIPDLEITKKDTISVFLNHIHYKISKALEAFRDNNFENFKKELANIIHRIDILGDKLNIDIKFEINKKLEKNKTRGYKHGNKKI